MFERYAEPARRTLFYARYEAGHVGSGSIDPEHLFLGMLRESGALVGRIFAGAAILYNGFLQELEAMTPRRRKLAMCVEMPFSNETKRILRHAVDEADLLAHSHVVVEHLLVGLVRERGSFAEQYLVQRGVSVTRVREQIRAERAPSTGDVTSRPTTGEALVALERVSFLLTEVRSHSTAEVLESINEIQLELQLIERALVEAK